jgi:hypothetical protein
MAAAYQSKVGIGDKSVPWRPSSILLVLFGGILVAIGGYFVLLRPALLPEDLRYIGLTRSQLETVAPQLGIWLKQVFRVMGGLIGPPRTHCF